MHFWSDDLVVMQIFSPAVAFVAGTYEEVWIFCCDSSSAYTAWLLNQWSNNFSKTWLLFTGLLSFQVHLLLDLGKLLLNISFDAIVSWKFNLEWSSFSLSRIHVYSIDDKVRMIQNSHGFLLFRNYIFWSFRNLQGLYILVYLTFTYQLNCVWEPIGFDTLPLIIILVEMMKGYYYCFITVCFWKYALWNLDRIISMIFSKHAIKILLVYLLIWHSPSAGWCVARKWPHGGNGLMGGKWPHEDKDADHKWPCHKTTQTQLCFLYMLLKNKEIQLKHCSIKTIGISRRPMTQFLEGIPMMIMIMIAWPLPGAKLSERIYYHSCFPAFPGCLPTSWPQAF